MRLIDADVLKEIVVEIKVTIDEDILECENVAQQLVYLLEKVEKGVLEKIDEQPTVEAKPVVHGEWLERDWFPFNLYCSVCGKEDAPSDFCSNCGADMRGEKRE